MNYETKSAIETVIGWVCITIILSMLFKTCVKIKDLNVKRSIETHECTK